MGFLSPLRTVTRASSPPSDDTISDETVLGESSIAAPVVDRSGAVIAAIGIVLPSTE